jgi:hypothetical protein
MQDDKKTSRDYGWVSARITEENRDLVDALRADGGLRSLSSTLDVMVAFVETRHREGFVDFARETLTPRRRLALDSTGA